MRSRTSLPTRKVSASGLGGAISLILLWALGEYAGMDFPPEVASAVTTVISFALAYLVPPGRGETKFF